MAGGGAGVGFGASGPAAGRVAVVTVDLMHKDVTLAARMAGPHLAHMTILKETLAAFAEAAREGWGGDDFSAVTHVIERRFGRAIAGGPPP